MNLGETYIVTGPSGSVIASNLAKKGFKIAMIDRATNIKSISDNTSFIFSILYHKILRNSR